MSPFRGLGVNEPCEDDAIVVIVTPFGLFRGTAGGLRRRGGGAGAALRCRGAGDTETEAGADAGGSDRSLLDADEEPDPGEMMWISGGSRVSRASSSVERICLRRSCTEDDGMSGSSSPKISSNDGTAGNDCLSAKDDVLRTRYSGPTGDFVPSVLRI